MYKHYKENKEQAKMNIKEISIKDYNYELPDERIAKFPKAERDHSKILIYNKGNVVEDTFYNIVNFLPENALMVFNNTKVIQARLHFQKQSGAHIEIFLLEPAEPFDYELMFQTKEQCVWVCMIGNLKKWKEGVLTKEIEINGHSVTIKAERLEQVGASHKVRLSWDDASLSFAELIDVIGELPIPPYLNRDTQESDKTTYQTVYSKIKGSVAAPTAGLHFTNELLEKIREKGVIIAEVFLDVGLGTFRPVQVENVLDHKMHSEKYKVPEETVKIVNDAKKKGNRVIAVGTTSVRTLESSVDAGGKLIAGESETSIFIYGDYKFKIVDAIITNFHLPKSTLIMLISAFGGKETVFNAYHEAIKERYRFYSFGDSMFIY